MEIKVKLTAITDVSTLVEASIKHSSEITASRGRYIVSASSLLGLWSLDLSQEITLHCEDGFSADFLDVINHLTVKE